ncbi:MAG: radical SAM family heme chaperone HemW [Actinobacteria bacterium]|nr:radical SAM family heme chaperone HemW [Actinomycetota bacterium]
MSALAYDIKSSTAVVRAWGGNVKVRLYLHWPFCRSRCAYCDFNTRVASVGYQEAYRTALLAEMGMWASMLGRAGKTIRSLYLGGGTPSCMSGDETAALLSTAAERFGLEDGAEVTVEVNPATWAEDDYARAVFGGANRFSVGVQSLHDGTLRVLSRPHGAEEAMEALRAALDSGARSVGADLLYGLPAGCEGTFLDSLEKLMGLGIHHLSVYALSPGAKTPLARMAARGEVALPEDEAVAEEYLAAVEILVRRGYEHYEISNFCRPGHRCRHNLAYWRREDYLGLGAGAHSKLGGLRFWNERSLLRYLRTIGEGRLPVSGWEVVTGEEAREEMVMLGMRTSRGVSERTVSHSSGRLRELARGGLLDISGGRVKLTPRGMLVSNLLIADLLWS